MAWFPKKARLFSPKKIVEAMEISPNTVRYIARKPREISDAEQEIQDSYGAVTYPNYPSYGGSYTSYNHGNRRHHNTPVNPAPKNYAKVTGAKEKYTWTPSKWSNFSFSYFTDQATDDNSRLFVKEPEGYMTPTISQIKAKVNAYSKEALETIKELSRVCYFKMLGERDYISNDHGLTLGGSAYEKKKTLYDSIFDTYIPGFSPLEQAIAVHWKLNDIRGDKNKKHGDTKGRNTRVEFRRENYGDPILNNIVEMNPLSKQYKLDILNKISIIGDLGSQFKVEKETGVVEVENSDTTSKRLMRSHAELPNIDMYQRLLPHYQLKFLTKDLVVHIPVLKSEKKQKIIMICDFSGSMNEVEKQIWVNALLIDRFRYVMKGEAELFFSTFVSNPNQLNFHHIKDADDIEKFWKTFSNCPGGSVTDIGRIVSYISDQVSSGKLHNLNIDLSKEKPEILIINDGQDSVGYDKLPYKVNAISIFDFSNELKNLCLGTGGKQVRITTKHDIKSYSIENGEKVEKLIN